MAPGGVARGGGGARVRARRRRGQRRAKGESVIGGVIGGGISRVEGSKTPGPPRAGEGAKRRAGLRAGEQLHALWTIVLQMF